MARHRSFKVKDVEELDDVTFDIEYKKDGKNHTEDFTAQPNQPGAVILDFIADADSNDGGRAAGALITFIDTALVEEDKERFSKIIRDPQINVDIEVLASICEHLISEYASRPTEPSSPSSTGTSAKKPGRTVRSSSRE